MKDFIKTTLAVVTGLFIAFFVGIFVLGGIIGSIAAGSSGAPALPKSGVLTIDMSEVVIAEQSTEASIIGMDSGTIGIWDAVSAVNTAAADPAVKFIFLKTDNNSSSITGLEELRAALSDFRRNSGKPIVSYLEAPSTGGYYLASVADKVYMTPLLGATSSLVGVGTQMTFLGDLLSRLGVNVQLIRHGKFKSAGEMYTRSSSSAENRQQYERLVESIWKNIGGSIAESRNISTGSLDDAINGLRLNLPEDFVACGLADALLDRDGLKDKLTVLAGEESYRDVKFISFADYVAAKTVTAKSRRKIAVIYADGEIVDGSDKKAVAGDRFAAILSKVRADSTVKAVVLRVNSPGGSVLASEKIKYEMDALKAVKPVVASYGSYAASGGYWISNNCDKVYSDAGTLTGSIGVFSMIPDLSGTIRDKAHIGIESVTSHKHADMLSLMRPLDRNEYDYMLRSVEAIYDKFTTIVSEGRGIPKETVDAIAQGRVWTGSDALEIGLVDEIGGIEQAIRYAALRGGDPSLSSWRIVSYPKPRSATDEIMDMLLGGNASPEEAVMRKVSEVLRGGKVLARMDSDITVR